MAKGHFKGIVVGGDTWEIDKKDGSPKLTGYSYKVMTLDDPDEKTGLHRSIGLVSVGTENKQYDKAIGYGAEVEFEGEFREGFNGGKAKMQYSNLKLVKQGGAK